MSVDECVVFDFVKEISKNNIVFYEMLNKENVKIAKIRTSLGCLECRLCLKNEKYLLKIYLTKKHCKIITSKGTRFDYSKEWLEFSKTQDEVITA